MFFFFKQKTAYELRISDWSSDVCSSDLLCAGGGGKTLAIASLTADRADILACDVNRARLRQLPPRAERASATRIATRLLDPGKEIGRASGRARVWQYV